MSITINATFDDNRAYELTYPHAAQEFAAKLHLADDPHCTAPGLPDIAKLGTDALLNMYTHACRNPYRSQRLVDRQQFAHFEGGLDVMAQEIKRRMRS